MRLVKIWLCLSYPYALTPNTVELIPTLGSLSPRGGPVQDPFLKFCVGSNTYGDATFLKCIGDQTPEATKLMKREGSALKPLPRIQSS